MCPCHLCICTPTLSAKECVVNKYFIKIVPTDIMLISHCVEWPPAPSYPISVLYLTFSYPLPLYCSCLLICLSPKRHLAELILHNALSTHQVHDRYIINLFLSWIQLNCTKQNLKMEVEKILVLQCSASLRVK